MKLIFEQGNLLNANVEALVNTVNCVGVMGKGIALQFKNAFPENYKKYAYACKQGKVQIGKMFVYDISSIFSSQKYIINFPTKTHWRYSSELRFIETGLEDLAITIQKLKINSIAIPPLGCGNGGLNWRIVKPLIIDALSRPEFSDLTVLLYEPK